MKNKVILVPFIFDDLSGTKIRPAVCLTDTIKPYDHIVVAFITSRQGMVSDTDLVIDTSDPEFSKTGLKIASTIRLHRLATIGRSLIRREIGRISQDHQEQVNLRLRKLFKL
jgi:mRNA interferase MazF